MAGRKVASEFLHTLLAARSPTLFDEDLQSELVFVPLKNDDVKAVFTRQEADDLIKVLKKFLARPDIRS